MSPLSDEQLRKRRLKARDALMRLTLWNLREMRDKYIGRSRARRPAKELRALKPPPRDASHGARKRRVAARNVCREAALGTQRNNQI